MDIIYVWENIEKLSTDRLCFLLGVPCCRGRISILEQSKFPDGLVDVGVILNADLFSDLESYPVLEERILVWKNKKAIAIADSLMTGDGIREIAPLSISSPVYFKLREGLKLRTLVNRLCQAELCLYVSWLWKL